MKRPPALISLSFASHRCGLSNPVSGVFDLVIARLVAKAITKCILACCLAIVLMCSSPAHQSFGQSSQDPTPQKLAPLPPSPQAASLGKYGSIPVGHATGVPSISIPIYDITLNGFNYPISLNYYSMGNKVDEVSSNVGLGWTLFATGSISTSTKGAADALPPDNWNIPGVAGDPCTYIDFNEQYNEAKQYMDGHSNFEAGLYYYNFAGLTGRLFFKPDWTTSVVDEGQNLDAEDGVVMPSSTLKVYKVPGKIWAIDEDGNRYYFTQFETSSMSTQCFLTSESPAIFPTINQSAFLSRIVTRNGDTIEFTYAPETYAYLHSRSQNIVLPLDQCPNGLQSEGSILINRLTECRNTMLVQGLRLTKIQASDGQRIEFEYSDRKDLYNASKIDQISIYNNGTQPVKKIRLYTSYFGGTPTNVEAQDELNLKLKLDAIKEISDNGPLEGHSFDYYPGFVTPRVYLSQDYFGYPLLTSLAGNPQGALTSIIPSQPDINYFGAQRDASIAGSQKSLLQRIVYPTKGYSEFEYELEASGGTRIKYIRDYNYNGTLATARRFKYSTPSAPYTDYWTNYKTTTSVFRPGAHVDLPPYSPVNLCTYWSLSSNAETYEYFPARRHYDLVEEITEDAQGNPNGKTAYSYNAAFDILPGSYLYEVIENDANETYLCDQSFLREPLAAKTVWKFQAGAIDPWIPVHRTEYRYEVPGAHEFLLKHMRLIQNDPEHRFYDVGGAFCLPANYSIARFQYISTWYRQKKVTETQYDNAGNAAMVSESETIEFDPVSLKPRKIRTRQSNGKIAEVSYQYPGDFTGLGVYDQMVSLNIVSPVVTQRQVTNNVLVNESVTSYSNVNSRFKPVATYDFDRGTTMYQGNSVPPVNNPAAPDASLYVGSITDITYDEAGNLNSFKQADGKVIMYKWGYKNQHFVARKEGGNDLDFYYTSFEEPDEGGVTPSNTLPQTGRKAYAGGSFTIPFSPANSSHYVMSYWYYQANSWHFSGVLPFGAINTAAEYIDEIRAYPKGSVITTYTYDFGKGATTITDHNSNSKYFEYDDFSRLSFIKDQERNLLNYFKYNYRK